MYSIKVRDHILIAHSLKKPVFGPAQNIHGATYIVDVSFITENLGVDNIVIDIGLAQNVLKETLKDLNYQNLDDHPDFRNSLSTTEFIAKYIHDRINQKLAASFKGKISVTVGESHIAWASYWED